MSEAITISFVGTVEMKDWLQRLAKADDRSVSYIVREILEKEAERQASRQQTQTNRANKKAA